MATKEQKNQKIEAIKESFAKAQVAIVSDPTGLSVEEITKLRRNLQKEGADYTVETLPEAKKIMEVYKFHRTKQCFTNNKTTLSDAESVVL